ncbi:MAG TPA: acyl-CoA dehydrogenase family protein [Phenylobacterium sp.]|uniref:acyl-CoA dehydrogenase family protein n=1 Tax=Phenylobacterium sp. TaxID=1871053 RepID=UPI002BF809A7|nr:acyl-CoA dehydrogenase family protein [Phenylobacterium sp.]HSV02766.1 acyl-CoA dehydrogenase family protein [Phenylobacterium sp.]
MADFGGTELETFRAEAREWLEANFPMSLRGQQEEPEGPDEKSADREAWKSAMGEKGWGTPAWPKAYGGGGLSREQAKVLAEEMRRIGAYNPIGGMGVVMFGPTLLEYGTEDQKRRHIPPIVKGELRWCQGFSEPGAGSDLAGLQTKAEDKGEYFLVNGQKIWTSGAHLADWCFCLTRTDPSKKHEGISFLLIDMKAPGVEPKPIRLINDTTPFCETFFTDVKVPKENLVGPLNGGWTIAKRLLQHERQGISGAGGTSSGNPYYMPGPQLTDLARDYVGLDETGRLRDGDLRRRITDHLMEAQAFALTGRRALEETKSNQGPSAASSVLKNVGSKLRQDGAELRLEVLGQQGLGWSGAGFTPDELAIIKVMLRGKAGTIAGGSYEIQNNIISKRILGLPETTQKG